MKFKDVMKKCFGKEKNDRWHAVAMLILYGIFFLVSYIIFTFGFQDSEKDVEKKPVEPKQVINYTYTYTVSHNTGVEVYAGKKYNSKEKFTLVKNGENSEYVVKDKNIYLNVDGNYLLTNTVDSYYKYLDKDKILNLVDYNLCVKDYNTYTCDIDTEKIASTFNDTIISDSDMSNTVIIVKENDNVKTIKLDLTNYAVSLFGEGSILTINMNYTDIGTTSDFDIKID